MLSPLLVLATLATVQNALAAFTSLSAKETFARMSPGWNLGNTLDALPIEGGWNSPPVQNATFSQIYADGFRSVRIPLTFVNQFISGAPSYTVNATWLSRVNYVVDAALSTGLYAVVNVHHDSWDWADMSGNKPDLEARKAKFEKLWEQLATVLKDKNEKLLFESLNEPVGSTQADANAYNDLNMRFLNVVRSTGGNNPQRVLSLPGLNDNSQYLTQWFAPPNNYTSDKWTVRFHYYSPWDFTSNSWGKTFWGSDADRAAVDSDFAQVRGNFTVPILIGEYGTSAVGGAIEKAAGWAWYDHVVRTAIKYTMVPQWWDNGNDFYDRTAAKWRDVTTKNIVIAAAAGKINTIPYNGNGTGIYTPTGTALTAGTDYTVITSPLTGFVLTSSYIASLGSSTTLGEIGRVIVRSSQGADLEIDIRRYTRPVIPGGAINVSGNTNDYYINFSPNGAKLATVKAVGPSGEIVKDDWTVWLGEPQAGRINWGDYGVYENQLIIYSALMSTIKNFGKPVTLTWEFWPRADTSNNATTVVTVT
ncbi:glycoside hydrolase family 5 protein [Rhizoctonia solani 123E]|uniref:Glycoside hydrolase family 5 protein n=1 Tax=Rhizoctonia solani 123E TaxID=1423351 RepID=A0A074RJZ3_9AGAM|nr:glycoside hydrolase family 5 protein [Rhizoctonia solani 123E]